MRAMKIHIDTGLSSPLWQYNPCSKLATDPIRFTKRYKMQGFRDVGCVVKDANVSSLIVVDAHSSIQDCLAWAPKRAGGEYWHS